MKKVTFLVIPDGAPFTKQFSLPSWTLGVGLGLLMMFSLLGGYFACDYIELRSIRDSYNLISSENQGLKGEARLLVERLDEVKSSLERVNDYTDKLNEITQIKFKKASQKSGIGPLTREEFDIARNPNTNSDLSTAAAIKDERSSLPLGLDLDRLVFKTAFDRLFTLSSRGKEQVSQLQTILSNLSQQKSLLMSVPSIAPVKGWITSSFGYRVSPFTGERSLHAGLDIGGSVGTPVYSPADGVVIFTGMKEGFGNFIMLAHGYGIVSRYGHNSQNLVQAGQRVRRGEQIATIGNTGRTTGPHLHYEIMVDGQNVNPQKFILDSSRELLVH